MKTDMSECEQSKRLPQSQLETPFQSPRPPNYQQKSSSQLSCLSSLPNLKISPPQAELSSSQVAHRSFPYSQKRYNAFENSPLSAPESSPRKDTMLKIPPPPRSSLESFLPKKTKQKLPLKRSPSPSPKATSLLIYPFFYRICPSNNLCRNSHLPCTTTLQPLSFSLIRAP